MEKPLLIADVNGDEIIVRTLGFFAYAKPSNAPQLILRHRTGTDNHELLAQAWHAANHKARELGWIVWALAVDATGQSLAYVLWP